MPAFLHPGWLLAGPPLLYLLWRVQKNSFAEGSRLRKYFWFLIRSIVLLLVLFSLAGLQLRISTSQRQIIFLIDGSQSISPEQKDKAVRMMNQTIVNIHSPDQVGIVAFGENAQVERFPAEPRPFQNFETKIDGSATDFSNAARLAEAMFASNFQQNLVLLSDGLENRNDSADIFRSMRHAGISTQSVYLKPVEHAEAGIASLRFPDEIRLNENFYLETVISANRAMPALVQIFRNGALLQEGTIQLQGKSKQLLQFPQKIVQPGLYRYQVKVVPKEDFSTDNNSADGWISVQGPPQILLVDENPGDLEPLRAILSRHGFEVDLKSPRNFPFSIEEMLLYKAIFIRNVAASEIHAQLPLIQEYVDDFGGGFSMLGGKKSFGPGGYFQTPVENVLPVRMDLVNKKYLADVAIVIVIDKSGSMSFTDRGRQKIDLADEGGARVASMLHKTDELGVLAVDSVPKWAYSLQKLATAGDAMDAITSIRAGGGGIYVYSGLAAAYEALKNSKAPIKHVILFADSADCEEKDGPSGEPSMAIAQKALRDYQITTTTIGIGQPGDADVDFLRNVAAIGEGRSYFTTDMFTLPEIFTQESSIVQRYYINEEPFQPKLSQQEPLMEGLDAFPELLGYVGTTAKPLAGIGLLSQHDDPVLAFWRHGLGQTVAFTSDPTSGWGARWLQWPEFERFWSQICRYLVQQSSNAHFRTSSHVRDGSTTVVVEALDDDGQFINNARFEGILMDGSGRKAELRFDQTAPGRYEAEQPLQGSLFGKIFRLKEDGSREESILQLQASAGGESETGGDGYARLLQLTGKVVDDGKLLRFQRGRSEDFQPLQNRLLLWAAFLFLFDVAVRKVDFRRLKWKSEEPVLQMSSTALAALKEKKRSVEPAEVVPVELLPDLRQEEMPTDKPEHPKEDASGDYLQRLKDAKKRA